MKSSRFVGGTVTLLIMLYLLVPLLAVATMSIAGTWRPGTILPDTYTLRWYVTTLGAAGVRQAIVRSFLIAAVTVVVSLIIVVPTAYTIRMRFPRLEALMRFSTLLPFTLPGVILALGLIQIYSGPPFQIGGTIVLLLCSYVAVSLPLMYYSIANSLDAVNGKMITEAAQTLGAGMPTTLLWLIVPNIIPGIVSGSLLTFATILGEFTLVNLLVGTWFKTLQIYLYNAMNQEGHLTSALTVIYFILVAISSIAIMIISRRVSRGEQAAVPLQ